MCDVSLSDSIASAPCFSEQGTWSDGYTLAKGDGPWVVVGPGRQNPNIFGQAIEVTGGGQYLIAADAQAVAPDDQTIGNAQINWLAADGSFIKASVEQFDVSAEAERHETVFTAPAQAAFGNLYVAPGSYKAVRYNEMSAVELSPVGDFLTYKFFGASGAEITAVLAALLAAGLFARFFRATAMKTAQGAFDLFQKIFPLLCVAAVLLFVIEMEPFYEEHYDMQMHQSMAEIVLTWSEPGLAIGGNPMTSFGVLYPINAHFSPVFQLGWLAPADIRIPVETGLMALGWLFLIAAFARQGGASLNAAFAIALMGVGYAYVPLLSNYALSINNTLGVYWQETALAAAATFFCFIRLGTASTRADVGWGLGMSVIILWYFIYLPYMSFFFTITVVGMCFGALIAARNWREVYRKLGVSGATVAALVALGIPWYVLGLFSYTPQMFYSTLYSHNFWGAFRYETSRLLGAEALGGDLVYLFYVLLLVGIVAGLRYGNLFARRIILAAVGFELFIHAASAANAALEAVPLVFIYVELLGLPLLAGVAALGVWFLLAAISHGVEWVGRRVLRRIAPPPGASGNAQA